MAQRPKGNYGHYGPPPYPPPNVPPYYRPPQAWPHAPPAYPPYPRPPPGYGYEGYEGGPAHGFFGTPPPPWQAPRNSAGRPVKPSPEKSPTHANDFGWRGTNQTPVLATGPPPMASEGRAAAVGYDSKAAQPDGAFESSAHRTPVVPGNVQANGTEAPAVVQPSSNTPTPPIPADVHAESYVGLKRENAALKAQLEAMKAGQKELTETWDVARNLLEADKTRFKNLSGEAQKEIAELKAKVKTLEAQSDVAALRKQVEDLSGKCLDLEVENKGLIDHLASLEEPQPEEEPNGKELKEVEVQTEEKEEKDASIRTTVAELATIETQTDSSAATETSEAPSSEPTNAAEQPNEAAADSSPMKKPRRKPPNAAEQPSEAASDSTPIKKPRPSPRTVSKKPIKARLEWPPVKKPSTGQKRARPSSAVPVEFTHEGHHYRFGDQRGGGRSKIGASTLWECNREGCPARVRTLRGTGEVVKSLGAHNHPPTETDPATDADVNSGDAAKADHRPVTTEDLKPESEQASTPEIGTSGRQQRPPRAKRGRQLVEDAFNLSTGREADMRSGSRASDAAAEPKAGSGDEPVALMDHPYTSGTQVRVPLGAYKEERVRSMFDLIVGRRNRGASDEQIESRLREVASPGNKDDAALSLLQHVLPFVPKP